MKYLVVLATLFSLGALASAQEDSSSTTRPVSTETASTRPTVTSTVSSTSTVEIPVEPTTTSTTAVELPTSSTTAIELPTTSESTTVVEPPSTVLPPSSTTTATPTTAPSPIVSTTISYDPVYDNKDGSLATVACSDGANGLLTKGYTTFGSLPTYPFIGGAFAVENWNSTSCGTCWQLTYVVNGPNGAINTTVTRINVLAIDVAVDSFNVALGALNELTGGKAEQLGRVPVTATQVDASVCGL